MPDISHAEILQITETHRANCDKWQAWYEKQREADRDVIDQILAADSLEKIIRTWKRSSNPQRELVFLLAQHALNDLILTRTVKLATESN